MTSYFSTSPNIGAERPPESASNATAMGSTDGGFAVVAGDYMPHTHTDPNTRSSNIREGPYSSNFFFATHSPGSGAVDAGAPITGLNAAALHKAYRSTYHQNDEWMPNPYNSTGGFYVYGHSPVSDTPSYEGYDHGTQNSQMLPPPPPPPPPPSNGTMGSLHGMGEGRMHAQGMSGPLNPYTYRGPSAEYTSRKQNRLHQDFKALPKEERQRLVEREAATSDLLARTVHLRFLPLAMLQSELADICTECGEYLRVRICGNSTNNQNWIYGFVEFATTTGADAMMRRSGMELPNGPGRPPLRLKCNSAKQPIVDRVFHDADPATGNPCIFGLGNFAKRSLGDALESYYNLKEKEAQQMVEDGVMMDGMAMAGLSSGVSGSTNTVPAPRGSVRLSPHARAFQPSSAASMLQQDALSGGLLTGDDTPSAETTGYLVLGTGAIKADGPWSSSSAASPLKKMDSTRSTENCSTVDSSSHSVTGVTPTMANTLPISTAASGEAAATYHRSGAAAVGGTSSSSAGTTPRMSFTPLRVDSAFDGRITVSNGIVPRSATATPATDSQRDSGTTMAASNPSSVPNCIAAAFHSGYLNSPEVTAAAISGGSGRSHATVSAGASRLSSASTKFLLPPSKHGAEMAAVASAITDLTTLTNTNANTTNSTMLSDLVGNELSLALQNMMLSHSATDGDEVLERGQELTLRAIGQAHEFLNSQQGFYDAMGTLRSLVELLDCHAAVTGGAAATGAGDHTAELPQRATQLRLLANLMMAFLYMMKRNLSDALPYIHAVVMSCNEIPVVCLWKAQQLVAQKNKSTKEESSSSSTTSNSNSCRGNEGGASSHRGTPGDGPWHGLAVGDGLQESADNTEGYDCFGAPTDFLAAVLESIREEEEEKSDRLGGQNSSSLKSPGTVAQRHGFIEGRSSANGDTASTSSAEMLSMLCRDQAFHRYVLNVLVAIGLSMEEVQPVITRSTYSLAAGRAQDVLRVQCGELDACLAATTGNPRLCDRLYGKPATMNGKRDITFFPRLFFTTAATMRVQVTKSEDKNLFWQRLPPMQCVQCYVE